MSEITGYLFTDKGEDAIAAFQLDCVRYAAKMDDGTGFAAFGGEGFEVSNYEMTMLIAAGHIMEPIPEYPDTWPQPQRIGPKRKVSNGMERFAIVSDRLAEDIMASPYSSKHVTGSCFFDNSNVLLETDGFKVPLAIWSASPTVIADKRLLVTT